MVNQLVPLGVGLGVIQVFNGVVANPDEPTVNLTRWAAVLLSVAGIEYVASNTKGGVRSVGYGVLAIMFLLHEARWRYPSNGNARAHR